MIWSLFIWFIIRISIFATYLFFITSFLPFCCFLTSSASALLQFICSHLKQESWASATASESFFLQLSYSFYLPTSNGIRRSRRSQNHCEQNHHQQLHNFWLLVEKNIFNPVKCFWLQQMWTEGRVIHFWEQFDKKLVWNSFLWKSNEDTPPLPNYSSLQCFLENAEIQKCKCFKKHCESEKMPLFCQIWTSKTVYQSRNTRLAKKHEIKSHAITNYRAVGIIWTFEVKWNFPTSTI